MNTPLTLAQKLLVTEFLTEALARVRSEELSPRARAEMIPGDQLTVKFGGTLAGRVSMPMRGEPEERVSFTADAAAVIGAALAEGLIDLGSMLGLAAGGHAPP